MRVLVTVKEDVTVDDEFEINGLDIAEQYISYELNEWDDYAIEEAVQLSEADDDVEVVTATIGPERCEETIRQALAKGADRAIRVWDEGLAEMDVIDPGTKADLFAGVVEEVEPDLVLTGVQGGDDAFGATGVALARSIDYEWAAVVNQLDLDAEAGVAAVHRELEGGVEELTEVELPAVLSIQTGINEPRYASLRGIRQAQSKPLDVHTPAELGYEGELTSSLTLTGMAEPESESDTQFIDGDAGEQASRLGDLLQDMGVVEG